MHWVGSTTNWNSDHSEIGMSLRRGCWLGLRNPLRRLREIDCLVYNKLVEHQNMWKSFKSWRLKFKWSKKTWLIFSSMALNRNWKKLSKLWWKWRIVSFVDYFLWWGLKSREVGDKQIAVWLSHQPTYHLLETNTDYMETGQKQIEKQQQPQMNEKSNTPLKLSDAEYEYKKKHGLCFKCPESWSKTHICQNKLL